MSQNHPKHTQNQTKNPEIQNPVKEPESETRKWEQKIIEHAYMLEELKSRDMGKLMEYVRKHRMAKQNEPSK